MTEIGPMNLSPTSLNGKRIVVTRPAAQAGELEDLLRSYGAVPILVPLIDFRAVEDREMVELVNAKLAETDWIVFTSSNAIVFFFALLNSRLDSGLPETAKLACVGPRTQQTLKEFGYEADFVPSRFNSKGLATEIKVQKGSQILYPSPKVTNPELVQSLQAAGATVTKVAVYETYQVKLSSTDARILQSELDAVTFTSPSVVSSFCDQVAGFESVLEDSVVACIGPLTAARAIELGVKVDVVPDQHTGPGLVAALVEHFEKFEREKQ